MTTAAPAPAPVATDAAEAELLTRVLSALLREDVVGLRTRGTLTHRPDGLWLRLPTGGADALLLPLAEDGFQCVYAARLPLLVRESDGAELTSYDTVLAALRALADPVDRDGFDAFAEECRQTLATLRLHAATGAEAAAHLTDRHGALQTQREVRLRLPHRIRMADDRHFGHGHRAHGRQDRGD